MYHVVMGTSAILIKDGMKVPFYTRKNLDFTPQERVKSDPGKLAFRRKGYVLIVDVKFVDLPERVQVAVKLGLTALRERIVNFADKKTIQSLSLSRNLNTAQILLAAYLISKYRGQIAEYIWKEATAVFAKQVQR